MGDKLTKTSIQLPPHILRSGIFPGISQSQALRLLLERADYAATLKAEEISSLAQRYASILQPAMEDLDYDDFRTVARSLPQIVGGFVEEHQNDGGWQDGSGRDLNPTELYNALKALHPIERIGVLDCIVAERHRSPEKGKRQPRTASGRRT